MAQAYLLARARLAAGPSPVARLAAVRDQAAVELSLVRREAEVLRGQREAMNPRKRPDYGPGQRVEILQIMRLRRWSIKTTAERFVLHPNTVRAWVHATDGRRSRPGLLVAPAWNRIHDAVRWAVRELRRLCPEPEFGTRTIAAAPATSSRLIAAQ